MRPQPRHELKHEISHGDYESLRRRIAPVMARDPHAGPADERFLAPHTDVPADVRGLVVLEVKYDRFLPGHLAGLLQLGDRPRQSYSKYEKCRTFY